MTVSMCSKKQGCSGCRNDYYNYGNNSSAGHCWSLTKAQRVWRWAIGFWTPMDKRENFRRVQVYDCYHGEVAAPRRLSEAASGASRRKLG